MEIKNLLTSYNLKKDEIKAKLKEFERVGQEFDERIFAELCFCICTPQSKAEVCDKAISALEKNNLLFKGSEKEIKPFLNSVRFADNKTKYIIRARKFFGEMKEKIEVLKTTKELRDWFVNNIKGINYKEASHFLRNIGLGKNLAILDRHILKNLKKYGVIEEIPKSLTRKKYLEIEQKMKEFSKRINIPMGELDLLFWSEETGKIFK